MTNSKENPIFPIVELILKVFNKEIFIFFILSAIFPKAKSAPLVNDGAEQD